MWNPWLWQEGNWKFVFCFCLILLVHDFVLRRFFINSLTIWMILTAINESIWSLMLKELLLYTTSSPQVCVRPAIYYLKKNMSDQVSVLVETLSGIYVHYYDYKIALMTSKVKLKFHLSHRILQTPSPPPSPPPRTPDSLSLNHCLFSRVFI